MLSPGLTDEVALCRVQRGGRVSESCEWVEWLSWTLCRGEARQGNATRRINQLDSALAVRERRGLGVLDCVKQESAKGGIEFLEEWATS